MKLTEHPQMKTKQMMLHFGDIFDTNQIKRRSDHEGGNKEENSEKMKKDDTEKIEGFDNNLKNAYEVDVV